MLSTLLIAACAAAPQGPAAPVVINEFSYDDSGIDNREFVELYNATAADIDIGDWVLDSEDPFGPNTAYTIPTGTILAAGDHYVLGSADVPNVDLIVGATNLWENSNESLTLVDASGAVIDTLAYETNKGIWNTAVVEGNGVWGNFASIDGLETSWSRYVDGYDTGDNGRDFGLRPSTPGASNNIGDNLPYSADWDGLVAGDVVPDFLGSFRTGRVIDPTVADGDNPNAIPASPQGGNAAVFWDNSGGGDTNIFLNDPTVNTVVETWVYIDATPTPTPDPGGITESEEWSIGIQGTTGTFSNFSSSGAPGGANGNTGISASYKRSPTGGELFLMDHSNGGDNDVILGSVVIVPGTNDGWQRLRLSATATQAELRLGGNFGQIGGDTVSGAITGAPGGVYFGYREFLVDNTTARPLTVDGFTVSTSCSDLSVSGDGTPGSSLQLDLTGAQPNALAVFVVSPLLGQTTRNLGVLGSIEFGLDDPIIPVRIAGTDAAGDASVTVHVPPFNLPVINLYGQAFSLKLTPQQGGFPTFENCISDVEGFTIGS